MRIILGSASPRRRVILSEMGYAFEVMEADIDERSIRYDDPRRLTLALANAKADAIVPRVRGTAFIVTSDLVVVWRGKIREKPCNLKEAKDFLRSYGAAPAAIIVAVVVSDTATGRRYAGMDTATIYFRSIPEVVIAQLVEDEKTFSLAGGFTVNEPLLQPYIERIEGEVDSILGLPKLLTKRLLDEAIHSK